MKHGDAYIIRYYEYKDNNKQFIKEVKTDEPDYHLSHYSPCSAVEAEIFSMFNEKNTPITFKCITTSTGSYTWIKLIPVVESECVHESIKEDKSSFIN